MAVDVLNSTAVILFNFSTMTTVSATNSPQTQNTLTLSLRSLRLCGEYLQLKKFLDIGYLGKAITE